MRTCLLGGALPFLPRSLAFLALLALPEASAQAPYIDTHALNQLGYPGGYGSAITGIRDNTGDGRGDFIVGAPDELVTGNFKGAVYLHDGTTGNTIKRYVSPNSQSFGRFGAMVARVPDVSGDGRDDILIGAWGEFHSFSSAGRAYLYSRPAQGVVGGLVHALVSPNPQTSAFFGTSGCGISDIDGDGLGDVVVGAPYEDSTTGVQNAGAAYVFSGGSGALLRSMHSPTPMTDGLFGNAIAEVRDVDADGVNDIAVGEVGKQRFWVFSGATGNQIHQVAGSIQSSLGFATSLAGVPDLNGDGAGDLLVGDAAGLSGRVHVYDGASGVKIDTIDSPSPNISFGRFVSGIEDVNGDGNGDLIVGAIWLSLPGQPDGGVFVYSGADRSLLSAITSPAKPGTFIDTTPSFGFAVGSMPDADGDGLPEYLIGSPKESLGGPGTGGAYVFFCTTEVTGSSMVRSGVPPNPLALTSQGTPIIGESFQLAIDPLPLMSGAAMSFFFIGTTAGNTPTPSGTYLLGGMSPPVVFVLPVNTLLGAIIPAACQFVGVGLTVQGGVATGSAFALANALDITIGTR